MHSSMNLSKDCLTTACDAAAEKPLLHNVLNNEQVVASVIPVCKIASSQPLPQHAVNNNNG
jgi:hypothetical protein